MLNACIGTNNTTYVHTNQTLTISSNNITTYFTVFSPIGSLLDDSYSYSENYRFSWTEFSTTPALHPKNTTAEEKAITLQAKMDLSISFKLYVYLPRSSGLFEIYKNTQEQLLYFDTAGGYLNKEMTVYLSKNNFISFDFIHTGGSSPLCYIYDIKITGAFPTSTTQTKFNVAKPFINSYIGINSMAKSIKKIYIGNTNNQAQLCWYNTLKYYKTLSSGYSNLGGSAATSLQDKYVLFAGGRDNNHESLNSAQAFSKDLIEFSISNLPWRGHFLSAASNQSWSIFAGGSQYISNAVSAVKNTVAYDANLVQNRSLAYLNRLSYGIRGATGTKDFAIFGNLDEHGLYGYELEIYNTSLTKQTITQGSSYPIQQMTTTTNNYVLGISENGIDIYDSSLSKLSFLSRTTDVNLLAAVSMQNYTIIAGGTATFHGSAGAIHTDIYAINNSLSLIPIPRLDKAFSDFAGAATKYYAIFAGGQMDNTSASPSAYHGSYTNHAEAYNNFLTKVNVQPLVNKEDMTHGPTATNLNNYIFFGHGTTIDVYST